MISPEKILSYTCRVIEDYHLTASNSLIAYILTTDNQPSIGIADTCIVSPDSYVHINHEFRSTPRSTAGPTVGIVQHHAVPPDPVDADQVVPKAPMPSPDQSVSPTQHLPQLFSDHERARSPSPQVSSQSSLPGTSAPLLTNPSMTHFLSNYPIWPTAPPVPLKSASSESDDQFNVPSVPSILPGAGTAPSFKRGRGRPPKAQKKRLV